MLQDRYYQTEACESFWEYLKSQRDPSKNPLIVMPTGTGKSVVIARIIEQMQVNYPSSRCIMLTHVGELVKQNYQKLRSVNAFLSMGVYSASLKMKRTQDKVIFATVQSVYAALKKDANTFGVVNLIIIDECHLVSDKGNSQYRTVIDTFRSINPRARILGLSATPFRLGSGLLTEQENPIFTDICYDLTKDFVKLIELGYLSYIKCMATSIYVDTSEIAIVRGDYKQDQIEQATNPILKNALTLSVEAFKKYERKAMLVFVTGIEQSELTAKLLCDMGISAAAVNSSHKQCDNDKSIEDFRKGQIKALASADQLTTGFDVPQVDLIIMLRPTASTGLHIQMLGRGTRVAEGKKECIVLDFARNSERLGPINAPLIKRSSKGKSRKLPEKKPMKECPDCHLFISSQLRKCPECGHIFGLDFDLEGSSAELVADTYGLDILDGGHIGVVEDFSLDYYITARGNPCAKLVYKTKDKTDGKTRNVSSLMFLTKGHKAYYHSCLKWDVIGGKKPYPESIAEAILRKNELPKPVAIRYEVPNFFQAKNFNKPNKLSYQILEVAFKPSFEEL